jgi:hypothetical protein
MIEHSLTKILMMACVSTPILTGCAHDYAAEHSFGESVKIAVREQSIRPDGLGVNGVRTGLEGAPSKAVIDRYNRSYESPQSLGNVLTIGVGTGASPASSSSAIPAAGGLTGVSGR